MSEPLFPSSSESSSSSSRVPLAERMRPRTLDEIVGQEHLTGEGQFLREAIASDQIPSLILWGPPGVGKTTLARVIAETTSSHFVSLSAVLSGVKDVRRVIDEAAFHKRASKKHTLLFVDEIHRFNKAQQDAFLPHVESGAITLIGATTENPSFEVISPLLSRTQVLILHSLSEEALLELLRRALGDQERGLGQWQILAEEPLLRRIASLAGGDARRALNLLEAAARLAWQKNQDRPEIDLSMLEKAVQRTLLYDKSGEEHFNLISAFHKSLRNSDVDASLYWLARILESGEDPLYVARRMVRFASDDVGLAQPELLGYAVDAMRAVHFLGMPEGNLALAQVAVLLAQAPKSNSIYRAYSTIQEILKNSPLEPVPLHLRNAPTRLMKELGYGSGYRYAHDEETGVAEMSCLPPSLVDTRFFAPGDRGFEKTIKKRLGEIERRKKG